MQYDPELDFASHLFLAKAKLFLSSENYERFRNILSRIENPHIFTRTERVRLIGEFCNVLKARIDLLMEFNSFLPRGYRIHIQGADIRVQLEGEALLTVEELASL